MGHTPKRQENRRGLFEKSSNGRERRRRDRKRLRFII